MPSKLVYETDELHFFSRQAGCKGFSFHSLHSVFQAVKVFFFSVFVFISLSSFIYIYPLHFWAWCSSFHFLTNLKKASVHQGFHLFNPQNIDSIWKVFEKVSKKPLTPAAVGDIIIHVADAASPLKSLIQILLKNKYLQSSLQCGILLKSLEERWFFEN